MVPLGLMPLGSMSLWPPGASNVMKVACGETKGVLLKLRTPSFMPEASNCVDAKSTPTVMNMFLRIFVFISCLWFVCPFTEVLQEIRRDITRKVWIFFGKTADYVPLLRPLPRGRRGCHWLGFVEAGVLTFLRCSRRHACCYSVISARAAAWPPPPVFRSADRRGADPIKGAVLRRRSSA